jgi:2-methylaconitate cis-trans-isomerase PrpF
VLAKELGRTGSELAEETNEDADLIGIVRVRLLFMNRLHESIAGSASVCLAAAAQVPGSVVGAMTAGRRPGELLIGHPFGITPAKVEAHSGPGGVAFDVLGFSRTARRLMDDTAYCPPLDQENAS